MADIKDWSSTAANNNDAPPDGAPENMNPSTVNNVMRENMAAVRRWYEDAEWRDFGDTATYVSGTSFTLNTDLTDRYVVNRRIRAVGSVTGTIYGTITASEYSDPTTTVTVAWDSGSLSSETLAVSLGLNPTQSGLPAFRGCLAYEVSDNSTEIVSGTWTTLPCGSEVYDTDDFHSTSTNTSRMTVPTGVSRVRINAIMDGGAESSGTFKVRLIKNGAFIDANPEYPITSIPNGGATPSLQIISPVISASVGDYFEIQAWQNSGIDSTAFLRHFEIGVIE